MAADDKTFPFLRKPNSTLWTATSIVIIYAVWCLLLLILTASGHFLKSQSFECVNSQEDATRLRKEARLVYLWSGLSLAVCILLLLEFWRKKGFYYKVLLGTTTGLLLIMVLSSELLLKEETQELQEFERRYLALLPLTDMPPNTQNQLTDTVCHKLNNVYRWQAEFKCCGLQGYQDWRSPIPDSCLCDGEDDSSGCVGVGDSLVYEKPCLPTVLSLVEKRSSTFWIVMAVWITIVGALPALCALFLLMAFLYVAHWVIFGCCAKLRYWIYIRKGGEKMVPVVFIRKNNNNETREDNREDGEAQESGEVDGVVLDMEDGTNVQGEGGEAAEDNCDDIDKSAVSIIPLSELRRLQEQLDPPPFQHKLRCLCIFPSKPKDFYTVLIEEGSPLLPGDAVLLDADKPNSMWCGWCDGPHVFTAEHIVWPREREPPCTP